MVGGEQASSSEFTISTAPAQFAPEYSLTKSPTASPVTSLTKSPTASPVTSLTKSPTASPVTTPTKSPTASPVTSSTTLLTGYVTTVLYRGSSCSDQYASNSEILNSCFRDEDTYRLVTATSTNVTETSYTDSKCTIVAKTLPYSYTDGVCDTSSSKKIGRAHV